MDEFIEELNKVKKILNLVYSYYAFKEDYIDGKWQKARKELAFTENFQITKIIYLRDKEDFTGNKNMSVYEQIKFIDDCRDEVKKELKLDNEEYVLMVVDLILNNVINTENHHHHYHYENQKYDYGTGPSIAPSISYGSYQNGAPINNISHTIGGAYKSFGISTENCDKPPTTYGVN